MQLGMIGLGRMGGNMVLRLLRAGVSTELHVFPRTCHGFDSLLPDWSVSEELFALQGQALRRAWHGA